MNDTIGETVDLLEITTYRTFQVGIWIIFGFLVAASFMGVIFTSIINISCLKDKGFLFFVTPAYNCIVYVPLLNSLKISLLALYFTEVFVTGDTVFTSFRSFVIVIFVFSAVLTVIYYIHYFDRKSIVDELDLEKIELSPRLRNRINTSNIFQQWLLKDLLIFIKTTWFNFTTYNFTFFLYLFEVGLEFVVIISWIWTSTKPNWWIFFVHIISWATILPLVLIVTVVSIRALYIIFSVWFGYSISLSYMETLEIVLKHCHINIKDDHMERVWWPKFEHFLRGTTLQEMVCISLCIARNNYRGKFEYSEKDIFPKSLFLTKRSLKNIEVELSVEKDEQKNEEKEDEKKDGDSNSNSESEDGE